ncbi:hypothetical protein PG995_014108 [Apiospora arundinis]
MPGNATSTAGGEETAAPRGYETEPLLGYDVEAVVEYDVARTSRVQGCGCYYASGDGCYASGDWKSLAVALLFIPILILVFLLIQDLLNGVVPVFKMAAIAFIMISQVILSRLR